MKPKIPSQKFLLVLAFVILGAITIVFSVPRLILSGPNHAPIAASQPGRRRPVLIDTDASFDDIAAILFLLQRTDIEILGITTVDGVAHADKGAESIQRLLSLMGRADIQVVPGSVEGPYTDKYIPSTWRVQVDNLPKLFFPPLPRNHEGPQSSLSAAQFIIEAVYQQESALTLIALGPFTNIAGAYQLDPNFPNQLQGVVFSGGALLDDPDSPFQDLNILADPASARAVFRGPVSMTIIPIDPTARDGEDQVFGYNQGFISDMSEQARWREMELLSLLFKVQILTGTTLPSGDVPVWDLTAVQIFADPESCMGWRKVGVQVKDEDPGRIIFTEANKSNVSVCYTVDANQLEMSVLAINKEE